MTTPTFEAAKGDNEPASESSSMSAEYPQDVLSDGEWEEWYQLTPQERWRETEKLWEHYLAVGGSLDPEPDSQSPFYPDYPPSAVPADGRPGVRVIRRSGV
jgi:hypothetical protein